MGALLSLCSKKKDEPPAGPKVQQHAQRPAANSAEQSTEASGGIIIGSSSAFKKKLDPKDFMCLERKGETVVKAPGSVQGQQYVIMDCDDCDIFVCDHCEMVTIDRSKNCRIFIGPCESSIFIRNCSNMKLVAACRQFRTRDCEDMDILMHCTSQPSIESSKRLRFGCFQYFYFALDRHFESAKLSVFNNRWSEIYNFTPQVGGHELIPPTEVDPSAMLRPLHELSDVVTADEAAMWSTDCPVPLTHGPAATAGAESCVIICTPRLGKAGVLDLIRALQAEDGIALARTIEFQVDAQWRGHLDAALRLCEDRAALGPAEPKARFVVVQAVGAGCAGKAAARVAAASAAAGSTVAYCSRTAEESEVMASALFVSDDSGQALR